MIEAGLLMESLESSSTLELASSCIGSAHAGYETWH